VAAGVVQRNQLAAVSATDDDRIVPQIEPEEVPRQRRLDAGPREQPAPPPDRLELVLVDFRIDGERARQCVAMAMLSQRGT